MEKPTEKATAEQGSDRNTDQAQITKWLQHDLKTAIALLNAIYSDPYLMDQVATFLHGKITNYENKNQQKLEFEKEKLNGR